MDRPGFFADRPVGDLGLTLFLNAGDPPLGVLRELILMLDERRVDCLELAVPFPNSVTDGPVIRRSATRALANGVELADVLTFVSSVRHRLRHMKIALLADWTHTVKPLVLKDFLSRVRHSGADALLVHGMPALRRQSYYEAAHRTGLPVVTTCYAGSAPEVLAQAGRHASAYVYLVAHYGRTGTATSPSGFTALAPAITALQSLTTAPIAVGFGVTGRSDLDALHRIGADAAVIGTSVVYRVEQALHRGHDVTARLGGFLSELRPTTTTHLGGYT